VLSTCNEVTFFCKYLLSTSLLFSQTCRYFSKRVRYKFMLGVKYGVGESISSHWCKLSPLGRKASKLSEQFKYRRMQCVHPDSKLRLDLSSNSE